MKPNVMLIVCCSLRNDMLGAKTPNMDRLAAEGMRYDNCISTGTWTFPSHVSIFTGMYANEHGVHEITGGEKVRACIKANISLTAPRLAEQMEARGYSTACISNNFMLSKLTGFQFGFQDFVVQTSSPWYNSKLATEARHMGATPLQVLKKLISGGRALDIPKYAMEFFKVRKIAKETNYPVDKGITKTVKMLGTLPLKPSFFLFLSIFDMHEPYTNFDDKDTEEALAGIKPMDPRTVERLKADYVEEVELFDRELGAAMETLKKRGLYEDTLVIITSDHGQAFNEHDFMYHGTYLYDEIVRVPLIVKYPKGRRFKRREGYQSISSIPALIESVLKGGGDGALTKDRAFSESYGMIDALPDSYAHRKDYLTKRYEKARAAVYMDGYKLNVNGSDGVAEEFLKSGKSVDPKKHRAAYEKLARELGKFKGNEKGFKIPRVPR